MPAFQPLGCWWCVMVRENKMFLQHHSISHLLGCLERKNPNGLFNFSLLCWIITSKGSIISPFVEASQQNNKITEDNFCHLTKKLDKFLCRTKYNFTTKSSNYKRFLFYFPPTLKDLLRPNICCIEGKPLSKCSYSGHTFQKILLYTEFCGFIEER